MGESENDWLWYAILGIAAVAIYKRSKTEKAKPRQPIFNDPIIQVPTQNTPPQDDQNREDSTFSLWNFGFRRGSDFDGEKPQI